jgi:hypothetical protein
MTMRARPISDYVAPLLLVVSTALAAGNWYVQPARAAFWASTLLLIACMMLAFLVIPRLQQDETARNRAGHSIRSAVVFAGLILAITLGVKLAGAMGAIENADFSRRATMVIMGAFFMFTGNAIPKTLTPLSALQCNAARVQAFQRFAGWMWVLTGLAFALVWVLLPLDLAKPVSTILLVTGILTIVSQMVRLRRTRRHREA